VSTLLPEVHAVAASMTRELAIGLKSRSPLERHVITRRLGLDGSDPRSFQDLVREITGIPELHRAWLELEWSTAKTPPSRRRRQLREADLDFLMLKALRQMAIARPQLYEYWADNVRALPSDDASPLTRCEACGRLIPPRKGRGRKRKYCGDACRQSAHRGRRERASKVIVCLDKSSAI
jgi:hypothetical protein